MNLFPDDWADAEIKPFSPLQAAMLWDEIHNNKMISSMIALQQNIPLTPYVSHADGEISRLKWIARFLLMWAMAFAQFVEEREKEVTKLKQRQRGKSKRKPANDDQ